MTSQNTDVKKDKGGAIEILQKLDSLLSTMVDVAKDLNGSYLRHLHELDFLMFDNSELRNDAKFTEYLSAYQKINNQIADDLYYLDGHARRARMVVADLIKRAKEVQGGKE